MPPEEWARLLALASRKPSRCGALILSGRHGSNDPIHGIRDARSAIEGLRDGIPSLVGNVTGTHARPLRVMQSKLAYEIALPCSHGCPGAA
jgi:hypothetical protein